jgi:hypothetical protein
LTASPLAATAGAPLLLADADVLPGSTAEYLSSLGYDADRRGGGWVLGPEATVGAAVADAASERLT